MWVKAGNLLQSVCMAALSLLLSQLVANKLHPWWWCESFVVFGTEMTLSLIHVGSVFAACVVFLFRPLWPVAF